MSEDAAPDCKPWAPSAVAALPTETMRIARAWVAAAPNALPKFTALQTTMAGCFTILCEPSPSLSGSRACLPVLPRLLHEVSRAVSGVGAVRSNEAAEDAVALMLPRAPVRGGC